jgi:hypothetical protein
MAEYQSSSEAPLSACTSCTKCSAHAGSHLALIVATCGHAVSERENGRCTRSVDVGLRREADDAFRLLRLALSRRDADSGHNFASEMWLDFLCLVKGSGCAFARHANTNARTRARTHTHVNAHLHGV